MSPAMELALANVVAWSVQVAALGLAAALLARVLPIERPSTRLAFGQVLLATVLVLPAIQPWAPAGTGWGRTSTLVFLGSPPPGSAPRTLGSAPAPPGSWAVALAGLLLVGVSWHLARLALGLLRLRALRRRAHPHDVPAWLRALRDELAPRARLVSSPDVASPSTFGLVRPVVVLPPAIAWMKPDEQEAVALHELLHVRRADWPALVLEELLKAVLFFHPTVHWLVGRVRLAREQAVDAAVIERLGRRETYLDSLIAVSRLAARARAIPAAPFLHESHLRERVDLLLKGVAMTRARTLAHLALSALGLVLVTTWIVSAAPLRSSSPDDSESLVPPARFVSLVGDVQVKRAGSPDWTPASPDVRLHSLDLVRTPPGASATLAFADGARINLRPDSLLQIDDNTARAAEIVRPTPSDPERPSHPHEPRLVRQVRPAYPPDAKVVLSAPSRERLDAIEAGRGTAAGPRG